PRTEPLRDRLEDPAELAARQIRERIARRRGAGRGLVRGLLVVRQGDGRAGGPAEPVAVDRQIRGDPVEPGVEALIGLVFPEDLPETNEGRLRDLLRIFFVS